MTPFRLNFECKSCGFTETRTVYVLPWPASHNCNGKWREFVFRQEIVVEETTPTWAAA